MTENKINNNNKPLGERAPIQIKQDSTPKGEEVFDINNLNKKNTLRLTKAKTKSREFDKRYDIFDNLITHGGKQRVSFIDKISKNNLVEVIKVDNYKEYNKMEEVTPSNGNGCCLIE